MRLLKSVAVFLTAVAILVAGVILPDLLLERNMKNKVNEVTYVERDELRPYGDSVFEVQQRLQSIILHSGEVQYADPEIATDYYTWDYDDCYPSLQNDFNTSYGKLLKFMNTWDSDLYDDAIAENITSRWIYESDTWALCQINFYDARRQHDGTIFFDMRTGLPVDIYLGARYISQLRIENIWTSLIAAYSDETGVEFSRSNALMSGTATSYDGTVSLVYEPILSDGGSTVLHFYLK